MGTNPQKKLKNNITVSRSGEVLARKIDAETGKADRSFAQPNPAIPHPEVKPKAHASEEEAMEALKRNSKKGRDYRN